MIYHCCDERRRDALLGHPALNGFDSVEVSDDPTLPMAQRQRELRVRFANPVALLDPAQFRVDGGVRIATVAVLTVAAGDADPDGELRTLRLGLDRAGDFSPYTLRLVAGDGDAPPPGFDPVLARIEFGFKAACPTGLDCVDAVGCPPPTYPGIEQGYLARDYASFRRDLLARIGALAPGWRERTPADLGVALVEVLAYIGDTLAYRQDAVGTEAYLGTARLRNSVRGHVRLVDYTVHEGCAARAWVQFTVRPEADGLPLHAAFDDQPTRVLSHLPGTPPLLAAGSGAAEEALTQGPQVFELLHDLTLFVAHNQLAFHPWGARECCLPRGATRATLRGHYPNLTTGDVLILAERVGAATGLTADADPDKRHAVRLASVALSQDPLGGRFEDPPHDDPVPITEITWQAGDALPFPLCISARAGTQDLTDIAVAYGNVALADAGLTLSAETLPPVPAPNPVLTPVVESGAHCAATPAAARPARYRPTLQHAPLVWARTYAPTTSATAALALDGRATIAQLWLTDSDGAPWQARRDLLAHGPLDRVGTVETETDGRASLRFGDGLHGARPAPGLGFSARYRIGAGAAGNVGRGALRHLISADPTLVTSLDPPLIEAVTNWLPARGGADPESLTAIRASAPHAFRTQERAVTSADFGTLARRLGSVQRVQATPRWTGSWRTTFVSVDRDGGQAVDAPFRAALRNHLEAFRLAGQDLAIDAPREVALELALEVCVAPGHFPERVRKALLERFHNRVGANGKAGLFHPDRFSFGEPVFLSPLVAAAQATPGVDSVRVGRFRRYADPASDARDDGVLPLARLEIARLDNDPNFPERGVFTLTLRGQS